HFRFVIGKVAIGDNLDVAEARSVIDFQEAETALRIAASSQPALEENLLAGCRGFPSLCHGYLFHFLRLPAIGLLALRSDPDFYEIARLCAGKPGSPGANQCIPPAIAPLYPRPPESHCTNDEGQRGFSDWTWACFQL